MEECRHVVGMDVGGSHICSCVVDTVKGEIVSEPFTSPLDSKGKASDILDSFVGNIGTTVKKSGSTNVKGVGFAFPGPFDYLHGISTVTGVNKFEKIYGLDLSKSLFCRLSDIGIEKFRYVNDAAAFALGESFIGAAAGCRRVVAITLGTGVGSGFVCDNKLVEAGESVPKNGWVYHLPFEDGIADEAFSTRWVCKRYRELTGKEVSGAKEVALSYDEDACSKQLFDEYGSRLGSFLVPLLETFEADILVLGGNISRAFPLFRDTLKDVMTSSGCNIRVKTSALLDKAAMIGAASIFHE